jgi:hypothetical protein
MIAMLGSLTLFAASAAATFEATMVPRKGSERTAGPTFVVEAGGGRRTRILDFSYEGGKCGSIYAPLLDAGNVKGGFVNGNGAAVFSLQATQLHPTARTEGHPSRRKPERPRRPEGDRRHLPREGPDGTGLLRGPRRRPPRLDVDGPKSPDIEGFSAHQPTGGRRGLGSRH